MTTQPQPDALRLADALLEPVVLDKHAMQAADELLRLHAECEALQHDIRQLQAIANAEAGEAEALRADAERWREARSRMSWVEYNADSLRWMFVVEMAHPEPGETKESIFGRLDEALAARAAKEQE